MRHIGRRRHCCLWLIVPAYVLFSAASAQDEPRRERPGPASTADEASSAPPQDDVPLDEPRGRVLARRRGQEVGDHALAPARDALQDLVLAVEPLAGEEHLRDACLGPPRDLEVQVRRPRAPVEGVRAGLDRRKAEPPLAVRHLDAVALEVWVERGGVRVGGVAVAAGGVGLPELDARAPLRLAPLVEDAPRHMNDLPLRARAVAPEACKVRVPLDGPDDGVVRAEDGARRGGHVRPSPRLGRAYCHHPGEEAEFEERRRVTMLITL